MHMYVHAHKERHRVKIVGTSMCRDSSTPLSLDSLQAQVGSVFPFAGTYVLCSLLTLVKDNALTMPHYTVKAKVFADIKLGL